MRVKSEQADRCASHVIVPFFPVKLWTEQLMTVLSTCMPQEHTNGKGYQKQVYLLIQVVYNLGAQAVLRSSLPRTSSLHFSVSTFNTLTDCRSILEKTQY